MERVCEEEEEEEEGDVAIAVSVVVSLVFLWIFLLYHGSMVAEEPLKYLQQLVETGPILIHWSTY